MRHEHAPQVAAQWADRRDPRSRIARGPRPAIDVDGRLKGFDAVAVTQPSPAVQPNFHERCRRVVSTPKQGAAAKSVVQGVAAGLQGHRRRRLPLRTSAPAGGQSAFAVQAIECTAGPTVESRSCTPEDLVTGLHRPRGLMGPERGRGGQGQRGERVRAGFRLNPIHPNLAQCHAQRQGIFSGVRTGGDMDGDGVVLSPEQGRQEKQKEEAPPHATNVAAQRPEIRRVGPRCPRRLREEGVLQPTPRPGGRRRLLGG